MKKRSITAIVFIVAFAFLTQVYVLESSPLADTSVDCGYFLNMYQRILEDLVGVKPYNESLFYNLPRQSNFSLPATLINDFNKSIEILDSLSKALATLKYDIEYVKGEDIVLAINRAYDYLETDFPALRSKLVSCTHDPALGATYSVKISLLTSQLVNEVIPRVLNETFSRELIEQIPVVYDKDSFLPGEEISVEIITDKRPSVILATWPSLRVIRRIEPSAANHSYHVSFRAPFLQEARQHGLTRIRGLYVLNLLLVIEVEGVRQSVIPLRVIYDKPGVEVFVPNTVRAGDELVISILSDKEYNATILVGNSEPINVTIGPGRNTVTINSSILGYEARLLAVNIYVNETETTVAWSYSAGILVEAPATVQIMLPDLMIVNYLYIRIPIVIRGEQPWIDHLKLEIGGRRMNIYPGNCEENCVIETFAPLFPVQIADIRISTSINGSDIALATKQVVIVNMVTLVTIPVLIILAVPLISGLEKGFRVSLPGIRDSTLESFLIQREKASMHEQPLITSRIVALYFRLLRKLALALPEPWETLREHYRRTCQLSSLRNVLWRFVNLAERDLYSKDKPRYEDAVELIKEVEESEW